jgi:hypothetical protein
LHAARQHGRCKTTPNLLILCDGCIYFLKHTPVLSLFYIFLSYVRASYACYFSPGSNNYERYKAWFNLPSLLGLTLNSPTISTTSLNMAQHSMANELHTLVHAAKCLALAQQQAADRVLTCGSRFLHPEAEDQAGDMLACFAKVAATTLYLRCVCRACRSSVLPASCCLQSATSWGCEQCLAA